MREKTFADKVIWFHKDNFVYALPSLLVDFWCSSTQELKVFLNSLSETDQAEILVNIEVFKSKT